MMNPSNKSGPSSNIASSSDTATTKSTSSIPTLISTESTSTASLESLSESGFGTSTLSSQCSSTPVNSCANGKYIIARSSAKCDKEGLSSSIMPTSTLEVATTWTESGLAEDTFYRLSNQFLGDAYSLAIRNKNESGPYERDLKMAISSDNSRQYWQIKRIPETDDRYWFACRFLGKDVRLVVDPLDLINPLMAEADDTATGQRWNVKRMAIGWTISNVLWDSEAELSTYSDVYELFMSMEYDTGTIWSITDVRKITAADNFL